MSHKGINIVVVNMFISKNEAIFKKGSEMNNFILVQTGFWGSDTPIYSMTKRNVLFFKLQYIPPYEDLKKLLSDLQIKERKINIFSDNITLVLDITEWVGKEADEYFAIIVKYLSDMSFRWNYIFTVNLKMAECMHPMFCFLRQFMQGEEIKDSVWESKDSLGLFLMKSLNYSSAAANILSNLFLHPKMENYRSNDMLEKITQEIMSLSVNINRSISDKDIKSYLKSHNNIIHLMLGNDDSRIIREITKEDICA